MKYKGITDVFFDLDHTLWDFERNSELAYQKIFSDHEININISEFLKLYTPYNKALWELYQEDKISKEELRYKRLKVIFDRLGLSVSDTEILQLSDDYITYLASFNHLFTDTIEILDYLAPKYKLHIITNGFAEVQQKKLKNSHIHHYFEVIMDSETAGVKKPNSLIFQEALKQANVLAKNTIMIGDSYETDILGAQNVGMCTLLYDPSEAYINVENYRVTELKQIKEYL